MPKRMLEESIKTSAKIDSLSWFEEVFFYRLIVSADDKGRCDGRPVVLKNLLFPTKENVTKKAVEEAIAKLVSVGLLYRYTVSGMPYLLFPTWEKHQRLRDSKGTYPEPPDDVALRQSAATCGNPPQNAASCGEIPPRREEKRREEEEEVEGKYARADAQPTPKPTKPARHKYGQYQNVLLSDEDMAKLQAECPADWQERIERLSEYMASKGASYKDHLATIRAWKRKEKPPDQPYKRKDYSDELPF